MTRCIPRLRIDIIFRGSAAQLFRANILDVPFDLGRVGCFRSGARLQGPMFPRRTGRRERFMDKSVFSGSRQQQQSVTNARTWRRFVRVQFKVRVR